MIIAARNGHLEILQIFIDNLPSIITRSAIRSQHLLSHAALRGQLDVVKFLIAQGALVNYIDELGGTHSILHSAVVGGHVSVAKYIIEETKCQDLSQDSAFHLLWCAIKEGQLEMVKYLVKCGASFTYRPSNYIYDHNPDSAFYAAMKADHPDIYDHNPGSAFDTAMKAGHPDMASFFLANVTPESLDSISTSGWKWMLKPCDRDNGGDLRPSPWREPHIAPMILDRVDLETQLATITPLEQAYLLGVAAETGNMSLTQRLLDKGCSPVLSELRYLPVSRAVRNGHAEITETLLRCPEYPVSEKDVSFAAKRGETAIVLGLLRKVGRNDFKKFAKVALDAASYPDQFIPVMMFSVFDILTEQDVETLISMVTSSTGRQASRHAAAVCPVTQFQAALAQWRFELDPDSDDCKAALVAAVLHKKNEIIQLFIEKGFDVTSTYIRHGKLSPLLHLAVEPLEDEAGVVIDFDDENQAQAQQYHYPNGHPWLDHVHPCASIQLLIEHGAEINQVDADGLNALLLTTESGALGLTKELLRLGANPLLRTSAKVSALELAISQYRTQYVKAFLKAIETHSFTCENFISLIPDALPLEMLPNRAPIIPGDRYYIFASELISVLGMLARDGRMELPRESRPQAWMRNSPQDWLESSEDSSRESSRESSGESSEEDSEEDLEEDTEDDSEEDSEEDLEEDFEENREESIEEDNFVPIWSGTEDDDSISDPRWARFFIAKAMTQHHWRMMYPVPI
ncbi:hypothetical protein N7471_009993 [Penicillium samsonianum]|uniref:uncharacterized protein n=1 Tax=Penicillium samsonianum TaxID=1882272 RepID=UPI00254710B1|nr:uncharacterized protein N7471_009993 [Penicillium samsonianum]KAJ6128776.1 hypothetical protein N7471_009993 [Penicillium samsonianum]